MPQTERSPSVSSTPRSGRRLLSRITSPFASKTRNVTDFYVQIPDVHKQYGPGETVSGAVHLRVAKPIRVTHVVVCLHGYVQVYKNPGCPPADGYRANSTQVGTGRGSRTGEYFGNGFASLFEDEVVLCGDGKLGEGAYQFEFNLEFPDRDLPSSISFERGTISYMITATITRPTTISPTIQCDHKVYYVESIDISSLLPPKARTITLEAISRRTKAKGQARRLVDSDRTGRKGDSKVGSSERRDSQTSSSPSVAPNGERSLQSPSPSEQSFDSLVTGSQGRPSHQESNATSPRQSDVSRQTTANGNSSVTTRTINATVESMKGGCLRGDHIPVKVHVNHIKHVKSLHGVIITLYRQARVDMHPSIPLGPTEKGKEARYEDYYPKSATGLGGLSLSGAGSSHMFRKDLSQTVVPLIVDPNSLTAEVTGKVHVDAEEFPTISTVPGAMISFRYYIEVVIDIQGKLSTQDRNLGNLGGLANTLIQGPTTPGVERERTAYTGSGTPLIDTAGLRRDKGVVSCTFEVVVGTRDTERNRNKGKQRAEPVADTSTQSTQRLPASMPAQQDAQPGADRNGDHAQYANDWYGYDQGYDPHFYHYHHQYHPSTRQGYQVHENGYHHPMTNGNGYHDYNEYASPAYIAPPPIPIPAPEDESQLTEKERVHRAEQRLLPSQPPDADGQASAGAAPSAPYLPDEQPNGSFAAAIAPPAFTLHPPTAMVSSSAIGTSFTPLDYASSIPLPRTPVYEEREGQSYLPSTPAYEPRDGGALTPIPSRTLPPTDDKRELERRNLQMEASAPPNDDTEEAGPSGVHAPSAPVLDENEELYGLSHDSHADASASSELPRYER
ncbi:pH-response regulator protein palF/RIM8 [Fulvia fulva]|uniref:PH-response regulator protein palF/RIM8 n=1 Tax=Passalora fulva TaxID=5499 RepID=A0A9Q8LG69_PASFU|nr:pH-response regulator protein palF/RIM8 [Fulvia fulva]UJO16599.1 pH-response regulator protein palF/RIM8 [Fulvia fulva]